MRLSFQGVRKHLFDYFVGKYVDNVWITYPPYNIYTCYFIILWDFEICPRARTLICNRIRTGQQYGF